MVNRREVAKRAGVSPITVSRVLGNYGSVSPGVVAKVTKAAAELGYRPNLTARSLKTNRTSRIGVIVHRIANPYYMEIIEGLEEQAKIEGYAVSICAASSFDDLRTVDGFLDQQFDGVVFAASWYTFTHTRLKAMVDEGLPVVFGAEANCPEARNYHRVIFDWQTAVKAAVLYLLGLGHTQIGFLSTNKLDEENLRFAGYKEAMAEKGLMPDERLLVSASGLDEGCQAGKTGMETLLVRGVKPTAVLAFNDLVALGAMATLLDAGLSVPGDISVMGHDDVEFASVIRPGLSTVRVPKKEQGRLLCWILARLLQGEEIKKVWPLEGGLVIRQTTQKPPD